MIEGLSQFTPFFTAGIFFIGFLAVLLGVIYFLLNAMIEPVKKDMAKIEKRIEGLETGQANLETGQANLEKRIDGIEVKLDTLLELIKKQ